MFRLLVLSAIWGSSFLFMRILAPAIGPLWTADLRVLLGGGALWIYFRATKTRLPWRKHWKELVALGAVNTALPFALFSYAALNLPSSLESILNSSSPLFSAIFSALWLSDRISLSRAVGLLLGGTGVAIVAMAGVTTGQSGSMTAIVACLAAASCYGIGGVYMKKRLRDVPPLTIGCYSLLAAGFVLLPAALATPTMIRIDAPVIACILGLGLLCSAVAYPIYYRLMADLGPTKALTVTFITPVFGMFWGSLLLGERITLQMIGGGLVILTGTALTLNLLTRAPRQAPARALRNPGIS